MTMGVIVEEVDGSHNKVRIVAEVEGWELISGSFGSTVNFSNSMSSSLTS